MGNTTSHKRHGSGDDSGPCLTTLTDGRNSSILDEGEMFDTSTYVKRPRASTLTAGKPEAASAPSSKLLPTVFKWRQTGKDVFLSGTFNNWKSKIPMVKSNGDFLTIVDLPPGVHNYKFLVDGQWVHDPNEPTVSNNLGGLNNVIHVKNTDFEVFEALDIDLLNSKIKKKSKPDENLSLPAEYGQTVPERRPNEKHPGPPILPPHLLQVILNKDTPAHCEPTLLPEPNHVMLNHLYALSIKDGVMVLSATHRFRKKYVTTLLYKPI